MSIKVSQPPQASRNALEQELRTEQPDARDPSRGAVQYVARGDGLSHRVYSLGLTDLAEGKTLSDARQVSWRYLLGNGGQADAAVEVSHDGGADTEHAFHNLNQGPFVQGTLDTLAAVETDPKLAGEFELRVLRVPAIYVMALWFKSLNGSGDVLVPMDPVHDSLTAGQLYADSEFMEVLRASAQERLATDDLP